jgi:hypothetical protein
MSVIVDTGRIPMAIVIIMNTVIEATGISIEATGGHGGIGTTGSENTHTSTSMEDITESTATCCSGSVTPALPTAFTFQSEGNEKGMALLNPSLSRKKLKLEGRGSTGTKSWAARV